MRPVEPLGIGIAGFSESSGGLPMGGPLDSDAAAVTPAPTLLAVQGSASSASSAPGHKDNWVGLGLPEGGSASHGLVRVKRPGSRPNSRDHESSWCAAMTLPSVLNSETVADVHHVGLGGSLDWHGAARNAVCVLCCVSFDCGLAELRSSGCSCLQLALNFAPLKHASSCSEPMWASSFLLCTTMPCAAWHCCVKTSQREAVLTASNASVDISSAR